MKKVVFAFLILIFGLSNIKAEDLNNIDLDIKEKAFRNAFWGMSGEEVERANAIIFWPISEDVNLLYPKISNMQSYRVKTQVNIRLIGFTKVDYVFFDDKLFGIRITVTEEKGDRHIDLKPEVLDNLIIGMLSKEYGEGELIKNKDPVIKQMRWETKITLVDYFLIREESTEDCMVRCILTCKPLYKAIEQ